MSTYAITDDAGTVRYYFTDDGETACELHREKFDTAAVDVRRVPAAHEPTRLDVGDRVTSRGDRGLVGTITAAPAPGMRRVCWDDGESGDADTRDLEAMAE